MRELSVGLREFLLKNKHSACGTPHPSRGARHLLLKEKVNFYCQHCDFERANAVRPYDVDFAFAIILRDAEDVIPYD